MPIDIASRSLDPHVAGPQFAYRARENVNSKVLDWSGLVGREPLTMALAFDDAVAEDRVVEQAEPLLDPAVGGDHEAGRWVAGDDQLVEVDLLLLVEPVQVEVVED